MGNKDFIEVLTKYKYNDNFLLDQFTTNGGIRMAIKRVLQAEPPRSGLLNSMSTAENVLIRQHQFPHEYTDQDKLICVYHDRLLTKNYARVHGCFKRHTGHGSDLFQFWAENATDAEIMNFLIEVLGQSGEWTGYRILGSVNPNGELVWLLELFRKHPKSETRLYTGSDTPNVLQASV